MPLLMNCCHVWIALPNCKAIPGYKADTLWRIFQLLGGDLKLTRYAMSQVIGKFLAFASIALVK